MERCVKDFTVINSQPSIEALENLMSDFFGTFGMTETIDDLFYYDVFAATNVYANFNYSESFDNKLDAPDILLNTTNSFSERVDYVVKIIKKVLTKEIEKPEWMKYVELNMECGEYDLPPSTFLWILPKKNEYKALAERLTEFLYSPNRTTVMADNGILNVND